MAITNITPLPDAPSRNDAPQDFTNKADRFVAALPKLVTELNPTITGIKAFGNNASTSEGAALIGYRWRSVLERLDDVVNVNDFYKAGYTDADAWEDALEEAISRAQNGNVLVQAPARSYIFTRQVSVTMPTTGLYNGLIIQAYGAKLIADKANTAGCIKISKGNAFKARIGWFGGQFVSMLDAVNEPTKNNGTALWITSDRTALTNPGLCSDFSTIVADVSFVPDATDEGDAHYRRGIWYRQLQIDHSFFPIVRNCYFRCPLDEASPSFQGTNHDAAVHMINAYAPNVFDNSFDGMFTAAFRNVGIVTTDGGMSWEGGQFSRNLVANAIDSVVLTHAFTTEQTLYEPGFQITDNHFNFKRYAARIKGHRQILVTGNYFYMPTKVRTDEDLLSAMFLEQASDVVISSNQFCEAGTYTSDDKASVGVRVDGTTRNVLVTDNIFSCGGICVRVNNATASRNTTTSARSIQVRSNTYFGQKNNTWATQVKLVDKQGNTLYDDATQGQFDNNWNIEDRTANTTDSPNFNIRRLRPDYASSPAGAPIGNQNWWALDSSGAMQQMIVLKASLQQNTAGAVQARFQHFIRSGNGLMEMFVENGVRGSVDMSRPVQLPGYNLASLPSAVTFAGCTVRVQDRGHKLATSDGTNWRYADGAIVS